MAKRKIKTIIIEDSRLYQVYMTRILSSDEQIEVGGVAGSGQEAFALIEKVQPDVITLDMALPDVKEYELLTALVEQYDIPVIVVTSIPEMCERAMELGAKDFIQKIQNGEKRTADQFAMLLKLKIKTQANSFSGHRSGPDVSAARQMLVRQPQKADKDSVIVIGASLGGTEATLEILKDLPSWMPGIVVVQHMPPGFTKAYAMRLDHNCELNVREAKNGDKVERGTVLIAKGGMQPKLYKVQEGYRVRLSPDDGHHNFCPSVDILFDSAARAAKRAATGIILTGMGSDGAEGMLHMHETGAHTIGQNEETCTVFGMPRAADELGGVDILLPNQEIAQYLIRRFENKG
ncbi:MAG: chemotaxis-specific protein-glutamate methyltransferase CheB [Clostridia bacterium]|nr:chemotaxis-specific protein-glutamate methyltransferase CheB [Clostridia bacterium]